MVLVRGSRAGGARGRWRPGRELARRAADGGHGRSVRVRAVRTLQREMAGGHVTRAERAELWLFGGPALLRERAPGAEPAPAGRGHRAGQPALDRDTRPR